MKTSHIKGSDKIGNIWKHRGGPGALSEPQNRPKWQVISPKKCVNPIGIDLKAPPTLPKLI